MHLDGPMSWSIPDNTRAKAFYRRNGFSPDGHLDDYRDEDPAYVLECWIR